MLEQHLLKLTRSGDHAAMLELWIQYADLVRRESSRFGRHTTFDIDDARQSAFVSLLIAAAEHETSDKDFTLLFYNRLVADLKAEAARQRFQVTIPLRTFRYVFETAARLNFDFPAARDHLASLPQANRRISPEVFDSVWFWAFSTQLEWSTPVTEGALTADDTVIDYRAGDAFTDLEDQSAVESLLSTLTTTEREVLERWYGLAEFEPQVSEVIGTVLGMNAASIRRIHSRVLAKLQIHSDLPLHWR